MGLAGGFFKIKNKGRARRDYVYKGFSCGFFPSLGHSFGGFSRWIHTLSAWETDRWQPFPVILPILSPEAEDKTKLRTCTRISIVRRSKQPLARVRGERPCRCFRLSTVVYAFSLFSSPPLPTTSHWRPPPYSSSPKTATRPHRPGDHILLSMAFSINTRSPSLALFGSAKFYAAAKIMFWISGS